MSVRLTMFPHPVQDARNTEWCGALLNLWKWCKTLRPVPGGHLSSLNPQVDIVVYGSYGIRASMIDILNDIFGAARTSPRSREDTEMRWGRRWLLP